MSNPIHPKVAWPAIATAVLAVAKAVLAWQHVTVPADIEGSVTALVMLITGYLAPNGTIATLPAPGNPASPVQVLPITGNSVSPLPPAGIITPPAPDTPRGA